MVITDDGVYEGVVKSLRLKSIGVTHEPDARDRVYVLVAVSREHVTPEGSVHD